MQIGFGAPVSGAWATPQNLAGFAARAEKAGYATLWSFQRLIVPEGSGMDPVYQDVLDPDGSAGLRRGGDPHDPARRRDRQPAVRLPRLPGQAGRVAGRALRRAARPGPGHRLDARGVHPDRRDHGPARRAHRRVHRGAAHAVGRRGQRVQRRVLHRAARLSAAQAGPAGRPAGHARRHGQARPGADRPPGRRLGDLQPHRPVADRRGHRRGAKAAAEQAGRDPAALRFICRGVVRAGARAVRPGRPAPAAVRQLRPDPRGRRGSGRAGRRPSCSTTSTGTRRSARPTPTRLRPRRGPPRSSTPSPPAPERA